MNIDSQPDRCERCWCDHCNGSPAEHANPTCTCENCADNPEYACTEFYPDGQIAIIAQQLAPLLSAHLNDRADRRCTAIAHTTHHALHDYDHPPAALTIDQP